MKKISIALVIAILAAVLINCAGDSKPNYMINGDIEGADGEIYFLKGIDTVNVVQATDGKFILSGELPEPGAYMIMTKRLPMMILVDENDTLNITGSITKLQPGERIFTVTGSDANEAFMALGSQLMEIMSGARQAKTTEERDSIMQKQTVLILDAAEKNIDNILGIYLLTIPQTLYGASDESILTILDKVPARLKETSLYKTAIKRFEADTDASENQDM